MTTLSIAKNTMSLIVLLSKNKAKLSVFQIGRLLEPISIMKTGNITTKANGISSIDLSPRIEIKNWMNLTIKYPILYSIRVLRNLRLNVKPVTSTPSIPSLDTLSIASVVSMKFKIIYRKRIPFFTSHQDCTNPIVFLQKHLYWAQLTQ